MHGVGCNFCAHTGFLDRIGVYELLAVTDEVRELIIDRALARRDAQALPGPRACARCKRRRSGLVQHGVTTIAEVMRSIYVAGV